MPKHKTGVKVWPAGDSDGGPDDVHQKALLPVLNLLNVGRDVRLDASDLFVYHIQMHNKEMTRWTAMIRTKHFAVNRYYEVYHNGIQSYIVNGLTQHNNASIGGIEIV